MATDKPTFQDLFGSDEEDDDPEQNPGRNAAQHKDAADDGAQALGNPAEALEEEERGGAEVPGGKPRAKTEGQAESNDDGDDEEKIEGEGEEKGEGDDARAAAEGEEEAHAGEGDAAAEDHAREHGPGRSADDVDALFGDDEDVDADAAEDAAQRRRMEDTPRAPPLHLEAQELPKPQAGQLCLVRLPNILGIEARPFDTATYDPELETSSAKRENVVRWRYAQDADGNVVRESNSRVVRWSDGSLTLHVGAEVLLAAEQPLEGAQSQVFAKHTNGLLECHGVLTKRLIFQPATKDSQTHQKLLAKLKAKNTNERRIQMTTMLADPEKAKEALERVEESKRKLLLQQGKQAGTIGVGADAGGWDTGFLEGEDEPGEGDLGAIRAQITGRKRRGSGSGGRGPRRRPAARRPPSSGRRGMGMLAARHGRRSLDDDEEEEAVMSDDGDEDEMEGFIVDDDEEEEDGGGDEEDDF